MAIKSSLKPVYIEWLDSNGMHGWNTKERVENDIESLLCVSVGLLLNKNDERVTIIQSESPFSYNNALAIPRIAVKKIRYLK